MSRRAESCVPSEQLLSAADSSEASGPEVCGHGGRTRSRTRLKRTRTVLPPLLRDSRVLQRGRLHGFMGSKELSHSQAGSSFTLGDPDRHELSPTVLFPSTLVIDGTRLVGNCKLGRPGVNSPPFHLRTVKDHQMSNRFGRTTVLPPLSSASSVHERVVSTEHDRDNHRNWSYADPGAGAPAPFMRRICELSSLEADTVRREKKRKTSRPGEPPP